MFALKLLKIYLLTVMGGTLTSINNKFDVDDSGKAEHKTGRISSNAGFNHNHLRLFRASTVMRR